MGPGDGIERPSGAVTACDNSAIALRVSLPSTDVVNVHRLSVGLSTASPPTDGWLIRTFHLAADDVGQILLGLAVERVLAASHRLFSMTASPDRMTDSVAGSTASCARAAVRCVVMSWVFLSDGDSFLLALPPRLGPAGVGAETQPLRAAGRHPAVGAAAWLRYNRHLVVRAALHGTEIGTFCGATQAVSDSWFGWSGS